MIVNLKKPQVLGSSEKSLEDEMSHDEFEDFYIDSDGTIGKSTRLNSALTSIDKNNQGENFNEEHSESLNTLLAKMIVTVKGLNDTKVKVGKGVIRSIAGVDTIEAEGRYHRLLGRIELAVDSAGPDAAFRSQFSMGNQEAYMHELVHAVMDFMMDPENLSVANDPKMQAEIGELRALYFKAGKESTWETLLPGKDTGTQYSEYEEQQAKDKWDYMFDNKHDTGFHEFITSIMTNDMVKKGFDNLSSQAKEDTAHMSLPDRIHKWISEILQKIVGMGVNKRDTSITKQGADLITSIMRANNNAVKVTAASQVMKAVDTAGIKLGEVMDKSDEKFKQFSDPFIGVFDAIDTEITKDSKLMDKDTIKEFQKLHNEVQKIVGKQQEEATGGTLKVLLTNMYRIIESTIQALRVLPKLYKMRGLVKGNKRSKSFARIYAKQTSKMLDSLGMYQEGFIRGSWSGFMNRPGMYNALADSILKLTHTVDNAREKVYTDVLAETGDWFGEVNIGNDRVNIKHNEALNDVILRPDIQSLGLSAKELQELLRDPKKVSSKIAELSKGLSKEQLREIKSLALYMTTGVGLDTNAFNIAREHGLTMKQRKVKAEQIDQLASYIALENVESESKETLLAFMDGDNYIDYSTTWKSTMKKYAGYTKGKKVLNRAEYLAQVENGIERYLESASGLQEASREEMIGRQHQVTKGYLKESYNSKYEIVYKPLRDRKQLEKEGFEYIRTVRTVGTTEFAMFKSNTPAIKRTNGALGLQDRKHRGYTLSDMINAESTESEESYDPTKMKKTFEAALHKMRKQYKADPTSVDMQPMFGPTGDIVNFRTTLSIADKKKYLQLEGKGTVNLARSYSTMGMADATTKHNKSIMHLLNNDYRDNYRGNEDEYVTIAPVAMLASDFGFDESQNIQGQTEYERLWARLPSDTKAYAAKLFGGKKIIVKKELLQIAFGDDDFSLSDAKFMAKVSPKTRARVRQAEALWQDLMQIAKSNIVIKIPDVLIGNIWSNLKILFYMGVHPSTGIKLMITSMKELKRYENESRELAEMERSALAGKKPNAMRMKELKASIKANTVTPLIDAGLYQSIVEDVSTAEDNNRVSKWFMDKTDKWIPNETANSAIQLLFMTQRTTAYQALLKGTQTSDFHFRFAQYYASVNKANARLDASTNMKEASKWINNYTEESFKPIGTNDVSVVKKDPAIRQAIKDKAMRDAIDNYINYEAPLQKYIRYGDAMGPLFFIKYWVRVQKVMKRFAKNSPVRVATDMLLQKFVTGDTPDIYNSLKLPNPMKLFDRPSDLLPSGIELF